MITQLDADPDGTAGVDGGDDVVGEVGVGGVNLDEAAARLSMAFGRLARVLRRGGSSELGPGSLSALATVVRSGPIRLGDLAAREGIAPPTLTRVVAGLEESGYLVRTTDPTDRRAARVEATPSALELITGTGSLRAAILRARLAGLPPEDLQVLLLAVPVLEALATDESPTEAASQGAAEA